MAASIIQPYWIEICPLKFSDLYQIMNFVYLAMKIPIGEKNAMHVYQVVCVGVCRGISIKTKTEDGVIDLYAR